MCKIVPEYTPKWHPFWVLKIAHHIHGSGFRIWGGFGVITRMVDSMAVDHGVSSCVDEVDTEWVGYCTSVSVCIDVSWRYRVNVEMTGVQTPIFRR